MPRISKKIVHSLILEGELAINRDYLLSQISMYEKDLLLLESGVKYSDLGISERRSASRSRSYSNGSYSSLNESSPGSVAVHKLTGTMRLEDGLSSYGVRHLGEQMVKADNDPNIDFHIIDVNSGGGFSTAGQFMFNTISDLSKPKIALVHFAGSAALMSILGCDNIVMAGKMSEIGSIGVYCSIDKEFANWYKENVDEIYSETSPDKNKDFRDYLAGDKAELIREVTKADKAFESLVTESRNLTEPQRDTLNGGMFLAEDGVRRGLADSVGTFNSALGIGRSILSSNKSDDMFGKNILKALNAKIFKGKELSENASEEDVIKAISEINLSDVKAEEIKTEVSEVETSLTEKLDSLASRVGELENRTESLEEENKELKEKIEAKVTVAKNAARKLADNQLDATTSDNPDITSKEDNGVKTVTFNRTDKAEIKAI